MQAITRLWARRFAWFVALWAGGVLALGAVAGVIRWWLFG